MGKISKLLYEKLIDEAPDRRANYLRVTRSNGNEVHIMFRNLRISLLDERQIMEWRRGFEEAYKNLEEHFKNDI